MNNATIIAMILSLELPCYKRKNSIMCRRESSGYFFNKPPSILSGIIILRIFIVLKNDSIHTTSQFKIFHSHFPPYTRPLSHSLAQMKMIKISRNIIQIQDSMYICI